uniref:Uncharacterized protein n=2 Tax=Gammaproteobacteria TaxID=1236 RepID=A0A514C8U0_MORMO|nr:hypothetical protein [Morganella morganii]QDX15439.1 hypothetical protein [Actinobacillus pleuropneumoniae]
MRIKNNDMWYHTGMNTVSLKQKNKFIAER